jgi:hypothetical protein
MSLPIPFKSIHAKSLFRDERSRSWQVCSIRCVFPAFFCPQMLTQPRVLWRVERRRFFAWGGVGGKGCGFVGVWVEWVLGCGMWGHRRGVCGWVAGVRKEQCDTRASKVEEQGQTVKNIVKDLVSSLSSQYLLSLCLILSIPPFPLL